MSGGLISGFSIDFHRRPYNALALPCQRVIKNPKVMVRVVKDVTLLGAAQRLIKPGPIAVMTAPIGSV